MMRRGWSNVTEIYLVTSREKRKGGEHFDSLSLINTRISGMTGTQVQYSTCWLLFFNKGACLSAFCSQKSRVNEVHRWQGIEFPDQLEQTMHGLVNLAWTVKHVMKANAVT